jgi:outer membrane protein insertion porin family
MRKLLLYIIILFPFLKLNAQVQIGGDSVVIDYANPKTYVIGHIYPKNVKYLDPNVLLSISGLKDGDSIEIPGDKISKAIQNLWKQGLFSDIKIIATSIQGSKIFLEIELNERPRVLGLKYPGISKSDSEKLNEKNKVNDRVITENLLETVRNNTRNYYVEKGYLYTEVEIKEVRDTNFVNRERLDVYVNKKNKVRIHKINFEGNKNIAANKLKHSMKETKEKKWWNIFSSSKYLEDKYAEDKKSIVVKYNDQGYRDAAIVSDTVLFHDSSSVDINIKVSEGNQYFFRNITWVGNTKHTSQELSNILAIKKGDVYDQGVLEQRLFMNQNGRDVSSLYMDDGYLFFSVTPVEINVENDSIDLEMRIYEGKQARINKVTISGNVKTNDKVIIREIRTKPGQLFNRSDIIRTQRELAQLGYFDQEKLGVNPVPNPVDGTVDIEYTVEEKPSDQLELSGGYGANQLVGTLGISFNNFSAKNFFDSKAWSPLPSGDGQRLSLRAQTNGKYYQSYSASFTEPWLGGKKANALTTSIFYSVQKTGGNERTSQEIDITGFSVGLGKRLKWPDDFFSSYTEFSYQYYTLRNYASAFLFSNGYANNISIQQTFSRNSIDAPIYPRTGSQVSFTLQLTPPWSKWLYGDKDYSTLSDAEKYKFVEYHKWKFSSSWFSKLAGNLVLNTKIQYGFLGYYNKVLGQSPFERFYLGGDGLSGYSLDGREIIALRGYENNSLTPQTATGAQVGGTIYDKYTLELRYPISLNPSATIYLLTFAEAGNSWLRFDEFKPFDAYKSWGGGIRIFLPVFGLLGLDWGYGFNEVPNRPDANGGQFHFTIGQQF